MLNTMQYTVLQVMLYTMLKRCKTREKNHPLLHSHLHFYTPFKG